jgi:hypothetical protein
MGTFLVRDNFPRHTRFTAVDDAAIGVWVQCLAYANEQETDGFIPSGAIRWVSRSREADANKSIRILVAAGLLDEVDGGWAIHDYLQHNPSKEVRTAKREAARVRMWRAKDRKDEATPRGPPTKQQNASREVRAKVARSVDEVHANEKRTSRALPALQFQDQDQDQSQVRREPEENPPAAPAGRARRSVKVPIPDDWTPTEQHRAFAARAGLDVEQSAQRMRDWAASGGERCVDWNARFRNWLATDADRRGGGGRGLTRAANRPHRPVQPAEGAVLRPPQEPTSDGGEFGFELTSPAHGDDV